MKSTRPKNLSCQPRHEQALPDVRTEPDGEKCPCGPSYLAKGGARTPPRAIVWAGKTLACCSGVARWTHTGTRRPVAHSYVGALHDTVRRVLRERLSHRERAVPYRHWRIAQMFKGGF